MIYLRTLCAVAIFAVAVGIAAAPETSATKPNIMVILSDDVGWSDIGAFGGEIATPNLDKLAGDGKIFTQFYNTARCCPTRASLLTGLYPHQAGIGHLIHPTPYEGYTDRLSSDSVTIPEVLKTAGYRNYMLGKWHISPRQPAEDNLIHRPNRRGFDKFYGTVSGSGSFWDPQTLSRDETVITPENDPKYKPKQFYYTDALSDNAVMFLKEHQQEAAEKPFFMYVAYTAAHWPLHAPEDAIAPYRGKYDAGYQAIREARVAKLKELGLLPPGEVSPTVGDWSKIEDKKLEASYMEVYAAMVTRMDEGIGRIIAQLKESGQYENTLILYLQDNGACAEDWFSKPTEYDKPLKPMAPDEPQPRGTPPMQTRDGRPVLTGPDAVPGPANGYTAYKENWANVSNTPLREYKHYMHEGGISTPLIAHWPAGIGSTSGSRVIEKPGHLIDIMATVIELSCAQYPKERQGTKVQPPEGKSLVPLLTGNGDWKREKPLFWEHESNRAVRQGKWKIVAMMNKRWELYDIEADRTEQVNLADKHPEIVAEMARQWDEWAARSKVLPLGGWQAQGVQPDPANAPKSVTLKQGEGVSRDAGLALTGKGVRVEVEVIEGPVRGVLAAQGASKDGYSLYAVEGELRFAVRRSNELHEIATSGTLPAAPFKVEAKLGITGRAEIRIIGESRASGDFFGPMLATPGQGLNAGDDAETPVRKYKGKTAFQGKLGDVTASVIE